MGFRPGQSRGEDRLAALSQPYFEPGEREIASLPYGSNAVSALTWLLRVLTGPVGWFEETGYSVVVTDRRLLLIRNKLGKLDLEAAYPRVAVSGTFVSNITQGKRLTLGFPDRLPLKLQVSRLWADAAREVLASLTAPGEADGSRVTFADAE